MSHLTYPQFQATFQHVFHKVIHNSPTYPQNIPHFIHKNIINQSYSIHFIPKNTYKNGTAYHQIIIYNNLNYHAINNNICKYSTQYAHIHILHAHHIILSTRFTYIHKTIRAFPVFAATTVTTYIIYTIPHTLNTISQTVYTL